jgi:hypothetical protein
LLVVGCWGEEKVVGCWLMVDGCWEKKKLLVVGCWEKEKLLVDGFWGNKQYYLYI